MASTVGVLCGGRSGEHEASLQSGLGIYEALESTSHAPVLVAIDKEGGWHAGSAASLLMHPHDPARISVNPVSPCVVPAPANGRLILSGADAGEARWDLDVLLPIIHGTDGEDGTLQGALRLWDVPFTGAGVLGSAVGLNKDVMKRLLSQADLPLAKWITLKHLDLQAGALARLYERVKAELGLPVFVKPASLGSSVGVNRAGNFEEFRAAVEAARALDHTVVIEESIEGREIEISVLGDPGSANYPPAASRPGEILPKNDFYSYRAKYLDKDGAELRIPAELTENQEKRIGELALQVFDTLECEGMARVDFFLRKDGRILVNEINTLPGFTPISMYPKMWEASGLPYGELLNRLIELAFERHQRDKGLLRDYSGNL